jgi:hypothetical protein
MHVRWYLISVSLPAGKNGALTSIACGIHYNLQINATFVPVATVMAVYYDVSVSAINWMSQIFMLASIPMTFVGIWMLDAKGLREAILVGAWLNALGAAVWCCQQRPLSISAVMLVGIVPSTSRHGTPAGAVHIGRHRRSARRVCRRIRRPVCLRLRTAILHGRKHEARRQLVRPRPKGRGQLAGMDTLSLRVLNASMLLFGGRRELWQPIGTHPAGGCLGAHWLGGRTGDYDRFCVEGQSLGHP